MHTTPGVYFQQSDRSRPAVGTLRTDIAGFIGYAARGPLLAPVKLTNWREFAAIFGEPLDFAHLGYAVRGFFDNGGAACHVVRVADPVVAAPAAITLVDGEGAAALRLWASFGELHDPATDGPLVENGQPRRFDNPGAWGNALAISVQPASRGVALTEGAQPADGSSSFVDSLSGFEVGSVIRISQNGLEASAFVRIVAIDAVQRRMIWSHPLATLTLVDGDGSDVGAVQPAGSPLRLESVEFTLLMHQDGQIVERHADLSLSPSHSRYVVTALQADSRLLDARPEFDPTSEHWRNPAHWPIPADQLGLNGGHDGLATIDADDFLAGLEVLRHVDEVSLLAAPDLVLTVAAVAASPITEPPPVDCHVIAAPPPGQLHGAVYGDSDSPVAGVTVRVLDAATQTETDGDGHFSFTGLPVGRVTLRLERAGYHTLETTSQSHRVPPATPATFVLAPVTTPPALHLDDIFAVQSAMLAQGADGLYRMALLDPPHAMLGVSTIKTWRARFDSAFAALYYGWLIVDREEGGVREVPPSGHVAGLIARTDLEQGVHRAPANFVLQGVKALTHPVDDAQQGVLNPLGINCLRVLPGRGIRVYGARTLSSDAEWRYLNVRRLLMAIEEAVEESHQWAVFEPNNQVLRQTLTYSLSSFLNTLWRRGALAGDSPGAAYRVQCDVDNNPPDVIDAGEVIAEVAVAPTIPFEFITFRLGRTVEAVEITE